MSFIMPADGRISSGFRTPDRPTHHGIDIACPKGTTVKASASGVVSRANGGCYEGNLSCNGGYGNHIFIKHTVNGKDYETVYAHLHSINVSVGQRVTQGQKIGEVGNTGHSYGYHLHFELHQPVWNSSKSYALDPLKYITSSGEEKNIYITIGDRGEAVKIVHFQLAALGYIQQANKERDIYDQWTADKVKQFQIDQKLQTQNGVYNYYTASCFAKLLENFYYHWYHCPNK
ncbi:peptidoglycan DD-metalloendopeptidase family protein [Bacillus aquiflavi]|uniref:Peptidoglycan DD-metalloendopeptidase family protein n=1 Tax=Bacillus aquiflavi TaxID=2672567 RepID=A0A6B3VYV2_9BACI|nr:peptidoglycan DD-metalloendopeptidase family protein [Bacillus aquiflavi]MBA4536398.1 peptidoglycan DD-metalloendopeptidase family protein [Bacillus aquiflavi]NEY80766.1 peptidoglycan DD-metalloendopeptidase family protein [Bacillus aquiflavi]UAC49142.1 M23 family metallopeptidase [Bacillus aquiflavi]